MNKNSVRQGGPPRTFQRTIDNLVLNQGMKGCNYAIAYEQYEEDSADPYLPSHIGRGSGSVRARCRCAGSSGPAEAAPAAAPAPPKIDTGDTAWVLASTALVMLMTAPGVALFYGGMTRSKKSLGTLMQSFIISALVSIQWVLWGYTLAFGPDIGGVIGRLEWFGLNGVGLTPNPIMRPPYRTRPSCSSR